MSSKKILILVNHDVVIYNFRRELVERFLSDGNQVVISSPYGERIDELVEMGCDFVETTIERHGINPLSEIKLIKHYKNLVKTINPDIILTFTIKPNIYGGLAARKYGVPYFANITGLGTAVEKKSIMQKITISLYKFAFSRINKIFFQNTENMNFFKKHNIVIDKHRLIPGSGVNLNHFYPLEYPSEDTIEFVFISRIMKEKGIEQYIDTAKYITKKYPKTKFHVCGFCEEEYEEKLIKLQDEGILSYHGMLRDVREILTITHCTIHPTYYPEGMSNVLLESSACGRPIITTDRSGCREVVENEYTGYITNQRDSNDLINKVEKFIKLKYGEKKKMGLAGREKVEREFDRNIIIEAYIEEISKVL